MLRIMPQNEKLPDSLFQSKLDLNIWITVRLMMYVLSWKWVVNHQLSGFRIYSLWAGTKLINRKSCFALHWKLDNIWCKILSHKKYKVRLVISIIKAKLCIIDQINKCLAGCVNGKLKIHVFWLSKCIIQPRLNKLDVPTANRCTANDIVQN